VLGVGFCRGFTRAARNCEPLSPENALFAGKICPLKVSHESLKTQACAGGFGCAIRFVTAGQPGLSLVAWELMGHSISVRRDLSSEKYRPG